MNKNDFFLILIILLIGVIFLLLIPNKKGSYAIVTYDNKEILKIDLTKNINEIYEVNGELGSVLIEQKGSNIRVVEENSPRHLCSKQGFISKSHETIVCLPNKIIIKIEDHEEIDGVV